MLAFLGGFLVVVAILAQFYASGQLMKTPLDVDNTTDLSGVVELSDGSKMVSTPVKATSITHVDSAKSDDDVAVWVNSSCLVKDEGDVGNCVSADDPQNRLIQATTDNFATDRVSGLAVNDPKYLPADAEPHEGLINKWPFESEKKTYPYWDTTLREAVDAVYDRTEEVAGVEVYVYKITITDAPAEISEGIQGTYSADKEIYVEPLTGSLLNQVEHREQYTTDGDPFLVLDLAFTEEEQKETAEDTSDSVDQLDLLTETVPLVGYAVGIPVLLIGFALMFLGGRNPKASPTQTEAKKPVNSAAK